MIRDTAPRNRQPTRLIIPPALVEKMVAHCSAACPNETCGILAGRDGTVEKIYEMSNIEPSPVSYLMDPKEQFLAMKEMRREGTDMVAIYHSHPQSPAYPSGKDVSLAFYPDAVYVIVSLIDRSRPEIRGFKIKEGNVSEIFVQNQPSP
jgi:proteasome lid subunit RPN8/RPN11